MKVRLISILLACLLLAGCGRTGAAPVAATTLPVWQFATVLCQGTGVEVSRLVTESVSCLHDYTLQVSQMRAIEGAELVLTSGAGLEGFLHDALEAAPAVTEAAEGITLISCDHDREEEHVHNHETDPHIWLAPENAMVMAENLAAALSRQYPEHQVQFEENLSGLLAELEALQAYGQEQLAQLSCRKLVTFHDGFSYFAQAFDLTILEAVEEEAGSEASARELIHLIGLVEEEALPAIFTETNGSTSAAQIIAAETGAAIHTLDMAMAGNDYFEAMYRNIHTVKEALG